jgi:CRP-like cAMP-binding protein
MAITATNCTLRSMPVETFVKTYQESRMFSKYVTNLLAIELALRLRVDGNSRQPPLRAKVMQFIEDCDVVSRSMPEGISPLKLKSAEIAQMVGSTPEHLSELLCQMEQEGLLGGAGSLLN